MKRILVVDDHAIVRSGIRRLLAPLADIALEDAQNGEEALALAGRAAFDLVILDLNLPGLGGPELLRRLVKTSPRLPVVVFSMLTEPIYVDHAIKTGALGYVSKNAAPEELLKAVRAALAGQSYIERELADELRAQTGTENHLRPLTNRDLEIMRLLAQGRTLTQIAQTLGVAYKTVANTCGNIKDKLGLTSTADLIRVAIERNAG
jgi:two-component system, NarL family, invasion response regulator UvrY